MQRLYSMFPGGSPGVGLIALRICVVAGMAPLLQNTPTWISTPFVFMPLAAIAVSILAGIGTPLASLVLATLDLACLTMNRGDTTSAILSLAAAFALACLGPGRWSIDATIFGRRSVHLPPEEEADQS